MLPGVDVLKATCNLLLQGHRIADGLAPRAQGLHRGAFQSHRDRQRERAWVRLTEVVPTQFSTTRPIQALRSRHDGGVVLLIL
jgi:hypothetical protein